MQKPKLLQSNSAQDTQNLAANIISSLNNKKLICLYGELGSGKTTFVQGLAKALEVRQRVISPTFTLVREYQVSRNTQNSKIKNLIHIDCYRIKSAKDIKSIDLKEYLEDKSNLVVIEWAEKLEKILPIKRLDIRFEYQNKDSRKIKIKTLK